MDWKIQNAGIWGKVHYPSNAIPSWLCRVPFGRSRSKFFHLAAPRVLQHLSPAPCHLPGLYWHIWSWNSLLPSSSHPSHTALFIQPESSWSQHHIQHSLTTGTSFLTPLPAASAVSKEGIADSCQHHAMLSLPKLHKGCTQGVAPGILCAEEQQDDRISCTIPYISKLIRALLEEPFNAFMEQPSGKVRGHPCDLAISSNLLLFMGRGLVVPNLYQTFPRAEGGNPSPSVLLKPNRINSSILLHYLPLKQRHCSPAAQNTELPESCLTINICLCLGWKLSFLLWLMEQWLGTGRSWIQGMPISVPLLPNAHSQECQRLAMPTAEDTPAPTCSSPKHTGHCRALTAWAIHDFPPNSRALSW